MSNDTLSDYINKYNECKANISNSLSNIQNRYDNIVNTQSSIDEKLSSITGIVQNTLSKLQDVSPDVTYMTIPNHIEKFIATQREYKNYFRVPKPVNNEYKYSNMSKMNESSIKSINTINSSDLSGMFANTNITSIDTNNYSVSIGNNIYNMDYFDTYNKNLYMSFEGSNIKSMDGFKFGGINTNVYKTFANTENLDSINLNISAKNTSYMFYNSGLNSVGDSDFNLGDCSHMFENCTNLKTFNKDKLVSLKSLYEASVNYNKYTDFGLTEYATNYYNVTNRPDSGIVCSDNNSISYEVLYSGRYNNTTINYINKSDDKQKNITFADVYNKTNKYHSYSIPLDNTFKNIAKLVNISEINTLLDNLVNNNTNVVTHIHNIGSARFNKYKYDGYYLENSSQVIYTNKNNYIHIRSEDGLYYSSGSYTNRAVHPIIYDKDGNYLNNSNPDKLYIFKDENDYYDPYIIKGYSFNRMYVYQPSSGNFFKNVTNGAYMFANCTNLFSIDGSNAKNIQCWNDKYIKNESDSFKEYSVTRINMYRCTNAYKMFSGCTNLTLKKQYASDVYKIGPTSDCDLILNRNCDVRYMFSDMNYEYGDEYYGSKSNYKTSIGTEFSYINSTFTSLAQYTYGGYDSNHGLYDRKAYLKFNISYPSIDYMFSNSTPCDMYANYYIDSNCTNAVGAFSDMNTHSSYSAGVSCIPDKEWYCSDAWLNLPNLVNGSKLFMNSTIMPHLNAPNVKNLSNAFNNVDFDMGDSEVQLIAPAETFVYPSTINSSALFANNYIFYNSSHGFSPSSKTVMNDITSNSATDISNIFSGTSFRSKMYYAFFPFNNAINASHAFYRFTYRPVQYYTGKSSYASMIALYAPNVKDLSYTFKNSTIDLLDMTISMKNATNISHIFEYISGYVNKHSYMNIYNISITNKCTNTIGWLSSEYASIITFSNMNICCDLDASYCSELVDAYYSVYKWPARSVLNPNFFYNYKSHSNSGNHYIIFPDGFNISGNYAIANFKYNNGSSYQYYDENIKSFIDKGWTCITRSNYLKLFPNTKF